MAARRVARTAVDWKKLAASYPKEQMSVYQHIKAKSDSNVIRVQSLPESLPSLDWAEYRRRAPRMEAAIAKLEKAYAAVKVDYPSADDALRRIDEQERADDVSLVEWQSKQKKKIDELDTWIEYLQSIPPAETLSPEQLMYYMPDEYPDTKLGESAFPPPPPDVLNDFQDLPNDARAFPWRTGFRVAAAPGDITFRQDDESIHKKCH